MAEQRNTSQKWRNVSLIPSMTPLLKFAAGLSPAMEVPRTAKSTSSGIAKIPTKTGTRSNPSQRYMSPMSNLSDPDCRSCPMVDSKSPSKPMANPRNCARRLKPLREVMQAMPMTESINSSGEPKVSTRGRTMGMATASVNAPIKAPTRELINAAPSARPASPRFAMG